MTTYASPVGDPTAVMGRRIGAFVVDYLLLIILVVALALPVWNDKHHQEELPTSSAAERACEVLRDVQSNTVCFNSGRTVYWLEQDDASAIQQRAGGASFIVWLLNWVVLQGLTGASVGKMLFGLRVVKADGQLAGFGKVLGRSLLLFVDVICCFLPGLIAAFASKGHRRIGDMAAGTNVVAASSVGTPPMAPVAPAGGWGAPPGGGFPPPGSAYPPPGSSFPPPGQPAEGAGWAAPPTSTPPASNWTPSEGAAGAAGAAAAGAAGDAGGQPPAPAPAPGGIGSPQWDDARKAYIQYDQGQAAWLQYDDASGSWQPISQ